MPLLERVFLDQDDSATARNTPYSGGRLSNAIWFVVDNMTHKFATPDCLWIASVCRCLSRCFNNAQTANFFFCWPGSELLQRPRTFHQDRLSIEQARGDMIAQPPQSTSLHGELVSNKQSRAYKLCLREASVTRTARMH
jgi:hypothetical protein